MPIRGSSLRDIFHQIVISPGSNNAKNLSEKTVRISQSRPSFTAAAEASLLPETNLSVRTRCTQGGGSCNNHARCR
jgi:hypothetical protein